MFPTVSPTSQRLLVFARLPELGRVKTRLAQSIGEERALTAYTAMVRDALRSVGGATSETEVEVLWAPTEAANASSLRAAFGGFPLAIQTGGDLGERLAMAFSERFFFYRTQKIIAIGVDDPQLSREVIDRAFGLLDSCDFVIGPSLDGGYYLIGCRGAVFRSELFTDIEWGTGQVFATTLGRIRSWERNAAVLPIRRDIDTAEDLRRYASRTVHGDLAALLREWEWR